MKAIVEKEVKAKLIICPFCNKMLAVIDADNWQLISLSSCEHYTWGNYYKGQENEEDVAEMKKNAVIEVPSITNPELIFVLVPLS